MNQKAKIPTLIISGIAIIGVLFIIQKLTIVDQETPEGELMVAACADIKAHETLRAETDVDKITEAISAHLHTYRDQSDTVIAQAVLDLRKLKDEVVFHNADLDLYYRHFASVLNQLSYLEMEDALSYIEQSNQEEARAAVKRAKHYLHDALTFSNETHFTQQMDLLHRINNFNSRELKREELESGLQLAKELI